MHPPLFSGSPASYTRIQQAELLPSVFQYDIPEPQGQQQVVLCFYRSIAGALCANVTETPPL